MANIFFNPISQSLPSSEAQDFSVEATYSFVEETSSVQNDWQIGEVTVPMGVSQNSRTLLASSSEQQVYAYSFHTNANTSSITRIIGLQFNLLRPGGDVLRLYQVPQPGQSTPATSPSLSLSPTEVRFLSSERSVASVTASIQNPGSSVSLTPTGPSWVVINSDTTRQVGSNLLIKTFLLTASTNQSAASRDSFVGFSLETSGETLIDSVSVYQPGRASVPVPTVNWATNLLEFESEGANVGTAAYVSGTVESNIRVTGDHTPIVSYTTLNNVVTASIQFSVPSNATSATRSTHMTVSAWNSAGTASSVLEIRTAGTDGPTPVLPSGSIVVESGNHITASAYATSTNFTVRYVNAEAGQYTIDNAGGLSGMSNPVSQSTIVDGNDVVVDYTAAFPTNLEAYPVTRRAAFRMHRGEGENEESVSGQADIYQEGVYAPEDVGVIIQNTPVSVAANVTQSTIFVTYSNALPDSWIIQRPSFSLGAYLINSASINSGQDIIRTYVIGYPANQTTNPVTHSVVFQMTRDQYHDEETGYIYQAAASPSPTTYAISCSWEYYDAGRLQHITRTIRVRYNGGQYPDDFVGSPITSSNITAISATSIPSSSPDYCEVNYSITAVNDGQNATVTFNIPRASVNKTATIHFTGAPDPSLPGIVVPGNPFNLASGDQIVTFTATYKNSYPDWTVRTAGVNKSDMHIVSSSVQVVGSDQQVTYEVTFLGNAGDLPVERRVFLLMTSGSGVAENERKSLDVVITQAGRLQVGTITLQPSRAWVAASDTQSTFYATYSFNGLAYQIQNPVGNRCTVTTVGSRSLDNGDQVYQYRVTFPTNTSTDTPVSRSVDCRMTTGSITAIETYIVAQDYQGGGGSKQILVNPTSKWLQANETTATTQVTYMGFSSAAQVSTPSCPSGWTATVGNVQESSGQVVINWIFTGTPNAGSGTKTNTFSIGASGATTKTFTIFQYGTGGGGGGGTTNTISIWKRNLISGSLPSARLRVTFGSSEIFNERVYAAPGEGNVVVDLNKICDPYISISYFWDGFWGIGDRGYGTKGNAFKFTTSMGRFNASFDSGENYVSWISLDRSYDQVPILEENNIRLLHVGPSRMTGLLYNQFLPFAVENRGGTSETFRIGGSMTPGSVIQEAVGGHSYMVYLLRLTNSGDLIGWYKGLSLNTTLVCGNPAPGRWAVYYWNSLGGMDTLPLHGPVVPSIDVSRNNYLQGIYNYTTSYLNGVVSRWRCNTGTFPDEYSVMVREMISSPEIALHDLKTDRIYVTRAITNSIEEKIFWNQGRKFATYQFDLEHILTQARR